MLFANNEPPNWFGLALWFTMVAWLATHLVLIGLIGILVYKVFRLVWKVEQRAAESAADRKESAADRKLTHELLTIVKGWALVVERKEQRKEEKMQQVADVAEKTAVEIKEVVAATVKATASEVVAVLDQRAAGASDSGTFKAPAGGT